VAVLEAVHKSQLEGQQTIVVRFEAMDKELVLVPVKVKTGTHRDAPCLFALVTSLEWLHLGWRHSNGVAVVWWCGVL
jgi:hypothetical protein